ncbi:hypothetical protein ABK040_005131 [Willaertia magna]
MHSNNTRQHSSFENLSKESESSHHFEDVDRKISIELERPSVDFTRPSIDSMGDAFLRPSVDLSVISSITAHEITSQPENIHVKTDETRQRNPYISLLFYNKRFLLIWLAGVFSGMGNYFSEIGVLFEVESRTNLGLATSAIFVSLFAPSCIAFPFAGLVSDIFDRRKVLVVCNVLRTILAFSLLLTKLLGGLENHWFLFSSFYVLLGLIFFINAFYDASRGVLLPLVVDHNELVACNALDSLTWLFCSYTGASIGGFVTQFFGLTVTYICNGLCFIIALLLSLSLFKFPELGPANTANKVKTLDLIKNSFKELVKGFTILFKNKGYLLSFTLMKLLGALQWASVEFINVKFSELPTLLLGTAELTMTLSYCLFGIGSGIAPMLCELVLGNRIRHSVKSAYWMRVIILLSFFGISFGFFFMFFSVHATMLMLANFIIGSSAGVLWVYSTSCIEHLCPNSYLGRVTAFDICFGFGLGQALGVMIPSPLLYDVFSVHTPHLFAVVMFCVSWLLFVCFGVWFYLSRNIKQHHCVEEEIHGALKEEESVGRFSLDSSMQRELEEKSQDINNSQSIEETTNYSETP